MLFVQIARNRRNTIWLLLLMVGIIIAVAAIIDQTLGTTAMELFILTSVIYMGWFYWHSEKFLMRINGAKLATEDNQPRLFETVEELCLAAGLPLPKIYVLPIACPNACATGCDPKHASIAVTQGLLDLMNENELRGVLAHELAHIRNYDIRVTTIAMSLLEVVRYAGWGLLLVGWSLTINKSGNWLARLIVSICGLTMAMIGGVIAIVGIPVAKLAFFAISREREYLADAGAVEITRDPSGLIAALQKLQADTAKMPDNTAPVSAICFNWSNQSNWLTKLFDTHPPLEKRIIRLQQSAS